MSIRIPNSIQIKGHTIDIQFDETLAHDTDALGISDYRNHTIKLQPDCVGYPVKNSMLEQAYLHEVLHFIFSAIGRQDLTEDEILVHNMAGCLQQVLTQRR